MFAKVIAKIQQLVIHSLCFHKQLQLYILRFLAESPISTMALDSAGKQIF